MKKLLLCVLCIFLCGSALAQVDSRLNPDNPPFPDVQILEIQLDNVTLNTAATPSLIYSFPYTGGEVTFAVFCSLYNSEAELKSALNAQLTTSWADTLMRVDAVSRISSPGTQTTYSVAFAYDANGNITQDGLENTRLEYDLNNMVKTLWAPYQTNRAEYFYYADREKSGVREFAIGANNQTTELFGRRYIGPFTLSEEVSTQNNQTARTMQMESAAAGETVYISNPAYTSAPSNTENPYLAIVYIKDHLGSTRAITTVGGTLLEQNDYYPFGLRTTRGQSYATLPESLASIAQSAGNTNANTDVPEYLYNGKEKQAFETAATNYLDYGARFYNPVTGRWNTQDPMAEKYQRYSPYSYCVNNPIIFVDPNGEDLYLTGDLAKMAFEQLQAIVKDYLTLEMDEEGKITYRLNEGVEMARRNAKRLAEVIDDQRIKVHVEAKELKNSLGGEFRGNERKKNENNEDIVETKQWVDPQKLEEIETLSGDNPGTNILHEITESYEGGKITLKKKMDFILSARLNPQITRRYPDERDEPLKKAHRKHYRYYKRSHRRATHQTIVYGDNEMLFIYNKKNEKKFLLFK